jgi:hypothetical protein
MLGRKNGNIINVLPSRAYDLDWLDMLGDAMGNNPIFLEQKQHLNNLLTLA